MKVSDTKECPFYLTNWAMTGRKEVSGSGGIQGFGRRGLCGGMHPTAGCSRRERRDSPPSPMSCADASHPKFAAAPNVLCGRIHASDPPPPKMRIHFGAILSSYGNREFCSDEFSTRLHPTTGFTRFRCGRNLAANGADSAVRKIPLKSPNMPPEQALLKGLSPQESIEIIQLIKYSSALFNLSHSLERCVP